MKSEPEEFSIDDLARVRIEPWSGVRSYFARANLRRMAVGDRVLFYHSSCNPPGAAGTARVVRTGVIDQSQFDRKSPYFDPAATREAPIWDCVEVEFVAKFRHFVPIERMRGDPELAEMMVISKRGMRLSVQPVSEAEFARVVAMSEQAWEPTPKAKPKPKPKATSSRRGRRPGSRPA